MVSLSQHSIYTLHFETTTKHVEIKTTRSMQSYISTCVIVKVL